MSWLIRYINDLMKKRPPDFVIGDANDPYLLRWFVIPRNPFFNIYAHRILHSDDKRALHDHPWWFWAILLEGAYIEITERSAAYRFAGDWYFRGPWKPHRLELLGKATRTPVISLVITGPKLRTWGFHCLQGWVPWQKYVTKRERGNSAGAGCG